MRGIVIAGTHSGCGKTTVTLGILAALKKKGLSIQAFKAGPDFIDGGIHRIITGRHSRNLDLWMCGESYVKDCFYKNSDDADISVVEGVMGLYDGEFSTARLAGVLGLPVILVIDAYGMAESAGALIKGFRDWELGFGKKSFSNPQPLTSKPCVAGVIFNRVASEKHYERLKNSVNDVPVLGYLPRDLSFEIPHRHLGLQVAEENPVSQQAIDKLADAVLKYIDVEKLIKGLGVRDWGLVFPLPSPNPQSLTPKIKIAVAYDKAFCFYYEDNLDLLRDNGVEIVQFSPLSGSGLPDKISAVYIGGGYPELYAKSLSENKSMLKSIFEWADSGKPLYAECGGLMYLSGGIYDFDDIFYPMAGIFPFKTKIPPHPPLAKGEKGGFRARLGYREVLLKEDCILGRKGDELKGHEFHYSEIIEDSYEPACPCLTGRQAVGRLRVMSYELKDGMGNYIYDEGYKYKNTLASYVHVHFGSNLSGAENFINFLKGGAWEYEA